jgi:hypothetical protein
MKSKEEYIQFETLEAMKMPSNFHFANGEGG